MIPLDEMYREVILDHYRAPRGKKPLDEANVASHGHNPSCGDEIDMEVLVKDNKLLGIHVDCKGCAISTASASILAETLEGKSFDEVLKIAATVKALLKGEIDKVDEELGDIDSLAGVRQFPVRIKCALLAWVTLVEGLKKYADGKNEAGQVTLSGSNDHDE
jgi:nitrogen fixation NifU-like protein